jgi:hypothetical protein
MFKKIISGGQTGADIAAIDAAIECNFSYGGWLPKGRKTEDGPLSDKYQMQEMTRGGYPKRTEQNIKDSSGTVIFTHSKLTGGSRLTGNLAESWGKPWLHINLSQVDNKEAVSILSSWLKKNQVEILNVAGSRASKDPEIYTKVFEIIKALLTSSSVREQCAEKTA